MDAPEDAGTGFRLAGRAAHDDVRGTDLHDTELGWGDIVTIEAASRPQSPAGLQAAVGGAHLEAGNGERTRSTSSRRRQNRTR